MNLAVTNTGLSAGWKSVKLRDVCIKITDGSHFSPKSIDEGFPYVTVKDIKNNNLIDFENCLKISKSDFENLVKNDCRPIENDVLFSKDGTVGKVALINYDKEFVVLSSIAILRPNTSVINSNYLFYILKSTNFLQQALNQKKGVAIRRIILRDLKDINLSVPPLSDQHAIVSKIEELLSELDKGIQQLETAQQQLKVYRQAVLKWAFEGKLTNQNVKEGELPEGWKWVKLGEVIDLQAGLAFKKSEYSKSGVRLFQIANVSFSKTKWDEVEYLPKYYIEEYPELLLKEGDIIMALNRPLLNDQLKIAEIKHSDVPAILYQRVGRFKFFDNENKRYFFYFMQSPHFLKWLKSELRGVNIPFINKSKLLSFDKYSIAPIEQQQIVVQEIESRLSVCDKLEDTINQSLAQVETLRQSILKKAFEGKLL